MPRMKEIMVSLKNMTKTRMPGLENLRKNLAENLRKNLAKNLAKNSAKNITENIEKQRQ